VINPLLKLLRKLTPVRTAMMTTMRPCFSPPSSRSNGTRGELSDTNCAFAVARDPVCSGLDTEGKFSAGAGDESWLLAGTNSIEDKSSNMMTLTDTIIQHENKQCERVGGVL